MFLRTLESKPQGDQKSQLDLRYGDLPLPPSGTVLETQPGLSRLLSVPQVKLMLSRAFYFGTAQDGVIEAAPMLGQSGQVEIGYYFGTSKPKNIIKVSAQIGCAAACKFCEIGETPLRRNVTLDELKEQVALMAQVVSFAEPAEILKPHKINIAGSGEPLLNPDLPQFVEWLGENHLSVKISTVYPRGMRVQERIAAIARVASGSIASTQLQISLISTDERYRAMMAGPLAAGFKEIRIGAESWRMATPNGRKINLSLILAEETPASAVAVKEIFPPELFRFRFRNYIPTPHGSKHGLSVISEHRLSGIKDEFRAAGYEVTDHATPTLTEQRFGLASNVTLAREGGTAAKGSSA